MPRRRELRSEGMAVLKQTREHIRHFKLWLEDLLQSGIEVDARAITILGMIFWKVDDLMDLINGNLEVMGGEVQDEVRKMIDSTMEATGGDDQCERF